MLVKRHLMQELAAWKEKGAQKTAYTKRGQAGWKDLVDEGIRTIIFQKKWHI